MNKNIIYKPLLDLIGKSEGTDKARGYNETLGYGAYTGGKVNLVDLSLREIDKLQTKMLNHPKNKLNSSAIGRYQIVRTTLRSLKQKLDLEDHLKFNEQLQDMLATYLLDSRGMDQYLKDKIEENIFILNLSKEWASLPTPNGKGYYDGQRASVSVAEVRSALSKVKQLYKNIKIEKPVDKNQHGSFFISGFINILLESLKNIFKKRN